MAGNAQRQAAVFAVHGSARGVRARQAGALVVVHVIDVAGMRVALGVAAVGAAARVDQTRGIQLLDLRRQLGGCGDAPLAPAFVERNPADDRGFALELLHDGGDVAAEAGLVRIAELVVAAGGHRRHVLPHHQADMVRPVVPARRLHLDVLADGVEAQVLRLLDVELQCRVGGRGVDAVGPVALVERGQQEGRLAVEHDAVESAHFLDTDAAQAGIAGDSVTLIALHQAGLEGVEEGILRTPQVRMRDGQMQRLAGRPARLAHRLAVRVGGDVQGRVSVAALQFRRHREGVEAACRGEGQLRQAGGRHRLQPHRLPDARRRGVEDALGFQPLLAHHHVGAVHRRVHGDNDLLRPLGPKRRGDVRAEGRIAVQMIRHLLAVDVHRGVLGDRTEVQPHMLAMCGEVRGNLHQSAIEHEIRMLLHAREHRLDRIWHQHLVLQRAAKRRRTLRVACRVLPQPVEAHPSGMLQRRPRQLRSWIVGQGVVRRHLGCPWRSQGRGLAVPDGGLCRRGHRHRGQPHRYGHGH